MKAIRKVLNLKADEKKVAYYINGYCQKQRATYWEFSQNVLWKDRQELY